MANIHDAILAINPLVVSIRGDVAYDKDEQIIEYDLAQAETKLMELQTQEAQAEQTAKNAKNSALSKFAKLGLTEDEVKALIG